MWTDMNLHFPCPVSNYPCVDRPSAILSRLSSGFPTFVVILASAGQLFAENLPTDDVDAGEAAHAK